ncbi:hypothetical protein BJ508DRAFT_417442 [Ascobolus immersus RN42]|uniref:Pre-mRNA-splicing factor SLU7 n=1 Tax=Ascobolus immersus RN42 TaxID=1160509 RepID=A0A3N4HXU2_ASCIM|nr:hypothetical protein BJ508DRAFT_417442 [Ascobolus immersus RN42]
MSSRQPRPPPKPEVEAQKRNEYIPNFIAKKPFYVGDDVGDDYLQHQRMQEKARTSLQNQSLQTRGIKRPSTTKFRKGSCTNCGSMTHTAKDCLQRRRKVGAKWSGVDIAGDEVLQNTDDLGWEGKRDRWNGYVPEDHQMVVEEYQEMEELRRKAGLEEGVENPDEVAAPGQGYDSAARISTRNLRIREDTAKYLVNLDVDSAKYDPKTRTMAGEEVTGDEEGEFVRSSGEAKEFVEMQRYAWEAREKGTGVPIHLQANPTEGEMIRKREMAKAEEAAKKRKAELLAKYGGEQYLAKPDDADDGLENTEVFVEYDERGQIKGTPKTNPKSKYPEDVYPNNHTSIWGSWWENFTWGYACCHSTIKNSYCAGLEGLRAMQESEVLRVGRLVEEGKRKREEEEEEEEREGKRGRSEMAE